MSSTAAATLTIALTGMPEGSESISISLTNSTAVGIRQQTFIGTSGIGNGTTFTAPPNARGCLIVGPGGAGSSGYLRIGVSSAGTSANSLLMASTGWAFFACASTNMGLSTSMGSTFVVWTTGTVSTSNPTRVTFV